MIASLRHLCEEHALGVLGLVAFASFVGGFMRAALRDAWALLRPRAALVWARWLAWWLAPTHYRTYRQAVDEADEAEEAHDYRIAAERHDEAAQVAARFGSAMWPDEWRMLAEGHRQSAARCRHLASGRSA